MPILGSSNPTANKDLMSKIYGQMGIWLIELKTLWGKESYFSFSHNVFKSCLFLIRQNEYLWSKGLSVTSICPRIEISGVYCFTNVRLSVFLSKTYCKNWTFLSNS